MKPEEIVSKANCVSVVFEFLKYRKICSKLVHRQSTDSNKLASKRVQFVFHLMKKDICLIFKGFKLAPSVGQVVLTVFLD